MERRHPASRIERRFRDHGGWFKVTVAENSHFSLLEGNTDRAEGVALSYRFDLADRSSVYTGDTCPSKAVV
jgi:hypothetical protein